MMMTMKMIMTIKVMMVIKVMMMVMMTIKIFDIYFIVSSLPSILSHCVCSLSPPIICKSATGDIIIMPALLILVVVSEHSEPKTGNYLCSTQSDELYN